MDRHGRDPPRGSGDSWRGHSQLLAGETSGVRGECRGRHKDVPRWKFERAWPCADAGREADSFSWEAQSKINDRKRAEEAPGARSEERSVQRHGFENAAVGIPPTRTPDGPVSLRVNEKF